MRVLIVAMFLIVMPDRASWHRPPLPRLDLRSPVRSPPRQAATPLKRCRVMGLPQPDDRRLGAFQGSAGRDLGEGRGRPHDQDGQGGRAGSSTRSSWTPRPIRRRSTLVSHEHPSGKTFIPARESTCGRLVSSACASTTLARNGRRSSPHRQRAGQHLDVRAQAQGEISRRTRCRTDRAGKSLPGSSFQPGLTPRLVVFSESPHSRCPVPTMEGRSEPGRFPSGGRAVKVCVLFNPRAGSAEQIAALRDALAGRPEGHPARTRPGRRPQTRSSPRSPAAGAT